MHASVNDCEESTCRTVKLSSWQSFQKKFAKSKGNYDKTHFILIMSFRSIGSICTN